MKDSQSITKLHTELLKYRGAMAEVARRTDVTDQYVSMILNGRRGGGEKVINMAIEVLGERKAAQKAIDEKIETLTDNE